MKKFTREEKKKKYSYDNGWCFGFLFIWVLTFDIFGLL